LAGLTAWLYRMRWWLFASLAALVVVGVIAFTLPQWLYPSLSSRQLDGLKGKELIDARNDRFKLQNDARTTLLQGLGGVAVLAGGYVAYQQLKVAQQGQITERLNTAINHLSSDNDHVRLGGIYALERIANNSESDREAIAEILTAYVRHHAKWEDPPRWPRRSASMEKLPGLRARKPDVQAAMTVLGRRAPPPPGETEPERLFLARVDLREAGLKKANLRRADLRGAHLEDAHLEEANLRDAQLEGAHLRDLEGDPLHDAHLEDADLNGASADTKTTWPHCFDPKAHGVDVTDDEPKDSTSGAGLRHSDTPR
jgi:Pentapeptide repeats (8 copies)